MTNAQGKVVVEVEKVYKDLQVLYKSMRASKFFKLCIQTTNQANEIPSEIEEVDEEQIVKQYRDLLNYLFKLIVKLNNGAE